MDGQDSKGTCLFILVPRHWVLLTSLRPGICTSCRHHVSLSSLGRLCSRLPLSCSPIRNLRVFKRIITISPTHYEVQSIAESPVEIQVVTYLALTTLCRSVALSL